jgi:glutathione S-transferase
MDSEIVLYGNTPITSPYVMSVYVALEEKGLPFAFEVLALGEGEQYEPGFVARSITNRVPTLRHGEFWLSESAAITEYLEERFPPPGYAPIYPASVEERARARMVQGLVRSDFLPVREQRSTETFFLGHPAEPLDAVGHRAAERLVRVASALLGDRLYVCGEFCIADVDLSTMLQRLVANHDPVPHVLSDYAHRVWDRPSVRKWLALTQYQRIAG